MRPLDLQVLGERRRDPRNGLSIPPRLSLRNAWDVATKPVWAMKVLFGKRRTFGNLIGRLQGAGGLLNLAEWTHSQFDASANWRDVEWVRSRWPGKLILKGVLDAEDAQLALAAGADAVVVSNHGGRQLDGAPSSISVLPEIVAAIDGRCEVLFDGGIRSGQDIAKALALGARGTLIGRSFLYALAAAGGAGGRGGGDRAHRRHAKRVVSHSVLDGTHDQRGGGPALLAPPGLFRRRPAP